MHWKTFLFIGLLSLVCTPALAQKPAIVLEVVPAATPHQEHLAVEGEETVLKWENLKFVFAGPDQITREVVTEAQVTVFDLASHTIVFQTDIYQVAGSNLQPGPNYTAVFHLRLQGSNGQVYNALIGSGVIELVVPIITGPSSFREPSRPDPPGSHPPKRDSIPGRESCANLD